MNKKDIRATMRALSWMPITDEQALIFIKSLADYQRFKREQAYITFCNNCAIFYTGCSVVIQDKYDSGCRSEDLFKWTKEFIQEARELRGLLA
jgi:hypothetical protein